MLPEQMSKTGKGRRTLFKVLTCLDEHNILGDFKKDSRVLFENALNTEMLQIDDNAIHFNANGETYIKWLNVKPNTTYFMTFSGRTDPNDLTDLNFGIVDSNGFSFENLHTKREKSYYVFNFGLDQQLTIRGQDGELYKRTYCFYTGENNVVGFFADGTVGKVSFEDLRIFEAVCAINPETRVRSDIINYCEDNINCLKEPNIINDLDCFLKSKSYDSFFETDGNKIVYDKNSIGGYYFYAWIPVEQNKVYTFVYKQKVLKKGDSVWGIIAQDSKGKRRWLTNGVPNAVGKEKIVADAIVIGPDEKIAFAFYDGGGSVEFSDFKVFLFGNAISE